MFIKHRLNQMQKHLSMSICFNRIEHFKITLNNKQMKRLMISFALLSVVLLAVANNPKEKETAKAINLNHEEFIEKVFDFENNEEWNYIGDKPAIIDFWAAWCGPCRQVSPVLEQLAAEYGDDIYVYKVNVDEESAVAQAFGIRSLPTILFVPTDEQPQAIMGAAPKAKLKEAVETILLKKEEKE